MKAEQLRKSILQLAIQGKLVPQDPNDEPASVLLERIRAEKQKLIKEGKIKKDKNESVIFKGDDNRHYEKVGSEVKNITDDLPFEIPDSWVWCRLNDIASISAGGTPERHNPRFWANGTIPWLKISDITSANKYVKHASEYINVEGLENSSAKILPKGTLLYTIFATIGEVGILDFDASCNQAIAGVQLFNTALRDYLYYHLVNLQAFMMSISKGCAQFNINQKILKAVFVPLPPLAEQARIVAEIEKFEPLIAEYDKLEQQATKLDEEIYDKLKKSILQYAIQGKLVPQDPNDEPVSVLLERIRAEKKAKLGKKYVDSYIYKGDDNCYYEHIVGRTHDELVEVPFELPNGWVWSKIDNIFQLINGDRGKNYPAKSKLKTTGEIPFISAINMENCTVKMDGLLYLTSVQYNLLGSGHLNKDDFVFCLRGSLGKFCQYPFTSGAIASSLVILRKYFPIVDGYIKVFLASPLLSEQIYRSNNGTAQPNLGARDVAQFLFPIPPLAEQKRIVAKIDEIFAML